MKASSTSAALLGALAPLAAAFPAAVLEMARNDPVIAARAEDILNKRDAASAQSIFEPVPIFDAEAQYIDITEGSGHEYVAPNLANGDLRGPCPGLNAFANHGFLPHNGYATATQFIDATMSVVGMGPALAAFLAVLGSAIDGDGLSWSIAGTPGPGIGGPLSGLGNGISGSHNKYESDVSPTRGDLYQFGDDYKVQLAQWNQLIKMTPSGEVTLQDLTDFRSQRFDDQIANNAYFFNGPFTGVLVQPAAYTFMYRFMANHTEEAKYGTLNHDILATWFGMKNDNGVYSVMPGQEKIPDNWYKRAVAYPYDTPYFLADATNAIAQYPKLADIGGNTGKTNSFTGVNIENLTGGLMNGQTLLQGNNLACFGFQFAAQAKPDLLSLLNPVTNALTPLTSQLNSLTTSLSCPQLAAIDKSQLMMFPGYKRANV